MKAITTSPIAKPIHNGLSTHNHDQAITPPSFKPINKIVSNDKNPTCINSPYKKLRSLGQLGATLHET